MSLRTSGAGFSGLLDLFPGAAAAYSLRALSSEWLTGDVVEVRRSSDNAELGFTATEIIDGTLTAWAGVGDAFVKTIYDQSGILGDLVQSTAASQAAIVEAGSLVTNDNGNIGLRFDGVNDKYETVQNTLNPGTTISGFCVGDDNQALGSNLTTAWLSVRNNSSGTNRSAYELSIYNNSNLRARTDPLADNANATDQFPVVVGADATALLSAIVTSGGRFTGSLNGVVRFDVVPTDAGDIGSGYGVRLGVHTNTAQYGKGVWSETLLWLSDQTDNRAGINNNINN